MNNVISKGLLFVMVLAQFGNVWSQDKQPFYFQVKRTMESLEYIGAPVSENDRDSILELILQQAETKKIQKILDKYALFNVHINPESRVKASPGFAEKTLAQNGWSTFLIKIDNQAGITAQFAVESDQAKSTFNGGAMQGMGSEGMGETLTHSDIEDRWLDLSLYTSPPMQARLSGLEVEYFILQLYSRDAGKRAAKFAFNCGQGTQDVGFRNETSMLFDCAPSQKIVLEIFDENIKPTTASLTISDKQGHIYPSQMKRLAPDFFFQKQIYRSHLETIELPPGNYSLEYGRGPEYLTLYKDFTVTDTPGQRMAINLERWIDPSKLGWYSGDHHIHAAGCSHYTSPTEGVNPEDIFKHLVGEGLNMGSILNWGPGYYHQKQFFDGKTHPLSTEKHLMRYDLEVSGFPSGHAGHIVLLGLREQDYPNTKVIEDWPSYTLPVLRWAKSQGAISGYAHSGLGLAVGDDRLPNYEMPGFDGIGANEFIVAVAHNLVDFISTMDTPPSWELNIWYHTLNNGFRTRISGETDFPCMSDEKVAHGRSYTKLGQDLNFIDWVEGIKSGRTYTSEGKSHLFDFKVDTLEVGTFNSELALEKPSKIKISAKVAALLDKVRDPSVKPLNVQKNIWAQKPFWTLERSRIGESIMVAVELIVNGEAIERKQIKADGNIQDVEFETFIEKSSWAALRIYPSSHTNPIFVLVDGKPIRANKKSAEWCLQAVDVCWQSKHGLMSEKDRIMAKKDYEEAKEIYRRILEDY
ncbi:CehA/McbA family metallohydrolase [Arenibacter sp. ARW7G5Y1]|uniref:CehA/McbA family metallohydrolase n=1 Tax=Arenibacter sp. ARW7G5Y1 TaxID=2135619 RepID=UPI000D838952|nr:CehA/McbA family metallohydrolase [Arenibacter sp. ARW7G5Y1]PXX30519.1 hypothetical protein C7972_102143 [Arenibacter sp. ARW7G5Y1]